MNRLTWLICCIVLLIDPSISPAQHRGGQGANAGGQGSSRASSSDDLNDFKRAMAVQASPDQVSRFKQSATSTQAAKKAAQDLLQLASNTGKPNLSQTTDALSSAVDEAQTDSQRFLRTFSDAQKSGLKDLTKKLGKANSEITRQNKALGHIAGTSAPDAGQIASVAEKLDKALGDFATTQSAIGTEMGIQSESASSAGK